MTFAWMGSQEDLPLLPTLEAPRVPLVSISIMPLPRTKPWIIPLFIQGWGVILLWALCSEATPDYAQGLCSAEDGAGSTQSESLNLGLSLWSSLFAIDNCTEVDQFGSPFNSKASG